VALGSACHRVPNACASAHSKRVVVRSCRSERSPLDLAGLCRRKCVGDCGACRRKSVAGERTRSLMVITLARTTMMSALRGHGAGFLAR
jgi:hypothetical protein